MSRRILDAPIEFQAIRDAISGRLCCVRSFTGRCSGVVRFGRSARLDLTCDQALELDPPCSDRCSDRSLEGTKVPLRDALSGSIAALEWFHGNNAVRRSPAMPKLCSSEFK